MRFVWSIIGIIIGVLIMKYTYSLVQTFGRIPWAESHLSGGLGGTYLLYKLIGLAVIFLSMLYVFGGPGAIVGPFLSVFGG
jgi:hypothetical protein